MSIIKRIGRENSFSQLPLSWQEDRHSQPRLLFHSHRQLRWFILSRRVSLHKFARSDPEQPIQG